jgi:hypothetical protein
MDCTLSSVEACRVSVVTFMYLVEKNVPESRLLLARIYFQRLFGVYLEKHTRNDTIIENASVLNPNCLIL